MVRIRASFQSTNFHRDYFSFNIKHFIFFIFASTTTAFPLTSVFADATNQETFTAEEVCARARSRVELIAARRQHVEETIQTGRQATMYLNPLISVEMGRAHASGQNPGAGPLGELRISQPFFFPGKLADVESANRAATEYSKLQLTELEKSVCFEAVYSAFAYQVAVNKLAQAAKRLQRMEYMRSYLRSQAFASPQRIAQRTIVQNQLILLERQLRQAGIEKSALFEKLNLYLDAGPETQITIEWIRNLPSSNHEVFIRDAIEGNYAILLNRASSRRTEAELAFQRKAVYPDFFANAFYRQEAPSRDDVNHFYGIGLTLPIPVLNRNEGGIASFEARAKAHEEESHFLERETRQSAKSLLEEYDGLSGLMRDFLEIDFHKIEEQLVYADTEFKRGRIDLLSYLQLEMQMNETLTAYYDTQLQAARANLNMMKLLGQNFEFAGNLYVFQNH